MGPDPPPAKTGRGSDRLTLTSVQDSSGETGVKETQLHPSHIPTVVTEGLYGNDGPGS